MKAEHISDAVGMLDEEMIQDAQRTAKRNRQRRIWTRCIAAAACVCLVLAAVFGRSGAATNAFAVAEAQYPEMAPYPDEMAYLDKKTGEFDEEAFSAACRVWWESRQAQQSQPDGYADGMQAFYTQTLRQLLAGADGENRVCSPLNLYLALSMLAEVTDGNTRQQILNVVGEAYAAALREKVSALWNANYCKDGATTSVLANSLWLREGFSYQDSTLDTLAKDYYASSYQGEMGTAAFNRALQDWLNEQTGGLLEEQARQLELSPDTVLALASTVYFQAKWRSEFRPSDTAGGTFYTAGGAVTCDFLHQQTTTNYYWADRFSAVAKPLENGSSMWLILPDADTTIDGLLAGDALMDLLAAGTEWENQKHLKVNLAIPKFDVSSDLDLRGSLQAMGITDVFDDAVSDFSPLSRDADDIFLGQARHAARVQVDEEGCAAAAYTAMVMDASAMPPEGEVDFVLNRPFLFVIAGADGTLLFSGVVNQPV